MVILLWCIVHSWAQASEASRSILPEEAPLLKREEDAEWVCQQKEVCSATGMRTQKNMSSGIWVYQSILVNPSWPGKRIYIPPMCATYYIVQSKEGQSPLWKCLGYPPGLRGWMHNPLKLWLIYDSSHNTHATLMQHSCNTYATPMQHTYVVSNCFWTKICDPKWLLDTTKRKI